MTFFPLDVFYTHFLILFVVSVSCLLCLWNFWIKKSKIVLIPSATLLLTKFVLLLLLIRFGRTSSPLNCPRSKIILPINKSPANSRWITLVLIQIKRVPYYLAVTKPNLVCFFFQLTWNQNKLHLNSKKMEKINVSQVLKTSWKVI